MTTWSSSSSSQIQGHLSPSQVTFTFFHKTVSVEDKHQKLSLRRYVWIFHILQWCVNRWLLSYQNHSVTWQILCVRWDFFKKFKENVASIAKECQIQGWNYLVFQCQHLMFSFWLVSLDMQHSCILAKQILALLVYAWTLQAANTSTLVPDWFDLKQLDLSWFEPSLALLIFFPIWSQMNSKNKE